MVRFSRTIAALTISALGLGVLVACSTPAAYVPRTTSQSTGYTDRALAANRYRVTFTGNAATTRETVENYLLLRAAEVTRAAGYTHFMFDSRDTMAQTRYTAFPEPGPGPGWGWWGGPGYWRFRPHWGYDPFGPDVDIVSTTRYEAFAEIVLMNAEQATREPRAVNAVDVIAHLTPPPPPPPR